MLTYKDMRNEMGMTQQEVANVLGVTKSSYSYIENYKRGFSLSKYKDFAQLYEDRTGKEINFLFDVKHK